MASKPTPEGQAISEVAHAEGGTTKGSASAQLQSELTKQKNAQQSGQTNGTTNQSSSAQSQDTKEANFQEAASTIGGKMQNNPEAITTEDAAHLESREHRAMGVRPPTDTISAEAKRMATANEKGEPVSAPIGGPTNTGGSAGSNAATSGQQSNADRMTNFEEAVDQVAPKMENDPAAVTKEDGDLLHSREQRAFGKTEKGGIASEAQRIAAENEGATK